MKNATTWSVEVGSFAWRMDHPGSDHDLFNCYITPTVDILAGRCAPGGCHVGHDDTSNTDVQSHEMQRWVDGALTGNLNYVVGLVSPIVYTDPYGLLRELREILLAHPSRAIVPSTIGMAKSSLEKIRRHRVSGDTRRAWKNVTTALRSLRFARRLLETGEPWLEPISVFDCAEDLDLGVDRVNRELDDLVAMNGQLSESLPARPADAAFREYLLNVRLQELQGWFAP